MSASHSFVVYIDESGDDGIGQFRRPGEGGQSHWLVLSACVVRSDNDVSMVRWRDEITAAFPRKKTKELHFRNLDHNQKVHACHVLAPKPIGLINVLSYKPTIKPGTSFEQACSAEKNVLYKYLLRYLLKKITDTLHRTCLKENIHAAKTKIVFSRRGGMDYANFIEYLEYLRGLQESRGSWFPIQWEYIDNGLIYAEDHSRIAGLQLVDVAASAFACAVEPNFYGRTEPRYARILDPRVMRNGDGRALYYGVKPVPGLGPIPEQQKEFFRMWAKNGRPPAPDTTLTGCHPFGRLGVVPALAYQAER